MLAIAKTEKFRVNLERDKYANYICIINSFARKLQQTEENAKKLCLYMGGIIFEIVYTATNHEANILSYKFLSVQYRLFQ